MIVFRPAAGILIVCVGETGLCHSLVWGPSRGREAGAEWSKGQGVGSSWGIYAVLDDAGIESLPEPACSLRLSSLKSEERQCVGFGCDVVRAASLLSLLLLPRSACQPRGA